MIQIINPKFLILGVMDELSEFHWLNLSGMHSQHTPRANRLMRCHVLKIIIIIIIMAQQWLVVLVYDLVVLVVLCCYLF